MLTVLAFLVAIGLLVTVHEFGHYLAARWCQVHVLRFSIGFGRPLWQYQRSPQHTQWVLALLPLGGYVQMLDRRDPNQASRFSAAMPRGQFAFDDRHPLQKILIVLAGPVANLLLAMVLYWGLLSYGETGLKPVLGPVTVPSLAASAVMRAGDSVEAIEGQPVRSWQDLHRHLLEAALDGATLAVTTRSVDGERHQHTLDLHSLQGEATDHLINRLGLSVAMPPVRAVVGQVLPASAAARGGLQAADVIVAVNGEAVTDWAQFVTWVRANPGHQLSVEVSRQGTRHTLALVPEVDKQGSLSFGKLGAAVDMQATDLSAFLVTTHYTLGQAALEAIQRLWQTIQFTLKMLGRLLTGDVSLKMISGPVSIAGAAGDSAQMGWQPYIGFLALLSISIAVMNLLPIPVLDGGHFMYHMAEWIVGKPLPAKAMEMGQRVGLTVLGVLMVVALFNDINRLVAG